MEAVLAMMVVICGVVLVTTSLSFVGIDLRRDSGGTAVGDGCRSLSDQFFALGSPFFNGEVLQNSSLSLLRDSLFHLGTGIRGYCLTLQDVTDGSCPWVLLKDGEVSAENDTRSLSTPVLLSTSDLTLHAAKVTVIVWS
jgi:hypothetical protein